jgi:hypothetical protein
MKKNIPFNPLFGKKPEVYIGREGLRDEILDSLYEENGVYRTCLITGLRGMGKTALLTDIEMELRDEKDWIVVSTSMSKDLLEDVVGNLQLEIYNRQNSIPNIESINLSVFGVGVRLDVPREYNPKNFQTIMKKCLRELAQINVGVLFTIDEVTNTSQMRAFVSTYQVLLRENYDIALLAAGLPHNVDGLISDEVLTFMRRATMINLERINLSMIKTAYQITFDKGGIKLEGNSLDLLSVTTRGYPYLFQLLGSELWRLDKKVITEEDVGLASVHARDKLFADVHSIVFRELSDMDQQFLMAMSEDPLETKIINLRERLEKSPGVISKYRERLMRMGIIDSEKYGTLQFVLPYMREFLFEKQKELYFIKEMSAEIYW